MKHYIIFTLVYVITYSSLHAQEKKIEGLQGLKDDLNVEYYEWAGYSFLVKEIKTPTKEKDIIKLKKEYKLKNEKEYIDTSLEKQNQIIYSESDFERRDSIFPDIKHHKLLYIFNNNAKKSDLLYLQKVGSRDTCIEKRIIDLYLKNQLSEYIVPNNIETINFLGRKLNLGNACEWKSPNNINCNGGQISWSLYDSYDKANGDSNDYIKTSKFNDMFILDEQKILLIFEGKEVTATRIVYQDIYGRMRYPLIVYYITSELGDKYISCILSYHGYNKDDYEMPELLKEVIEVKELPETAWNKYSVPQKDELTSSQKQTIKNKKGSSLLYNFFTVKSGIYMPLARKRDILGTSPFVELEYNINFSSSNYSKSSIMLNIGFVIANDRKKFNYSNKDQIIEAKATSLFSVGAGYKYTYQITGNLFWDNYIRIGISSLTTNKKLKEKKKKDENDTYSIDVFSGVLGTHLRYKKLGMFIEYQYAPYEKSKHLQTGGNSAFLTGVSFSF